MAESEGLFVTGNAEDDDLLAKLDEWIVGQVDFESVLGELQTPRTEETIYAIGWCQWKDFVEGGDVILRDAPGGDPVLTISRHLVKSLKEWQDVSQITVSG